MTTDTPEPPDSGPASLTQAEPAPPAAEGRSGADTVPESAPDSGPDHAPESVPDAQTQDAQSKSARSGGTGSAPARWRWIALGLFAVGVALVALFSFRMAHAWRDFHDVRGRPISEDLNRVRPWMTLPDVAREFNVPLDRLYADLGVPPRTPDRRTLRDLNNQFAQRKKGFFEEEVRTLIGEYRRTQQPPPPIPAGPLPAGPPPAGPALTGPGPRPQNGPAENGPVENGPAENGAPESPLEKSAP